jgi:hypothetical protein
MAGRVRARSEENYRGRQHAHFPVGQRNPDCSVGAQPRSPLDQLDAVPGEVLRHGLGHDRDDFGLAHHQALEGDVGIELETQPVHFAVAKSALIQGRLAQGFGGDPSTAHRIAAGRRGLLKEGDGLVVVGRLCGAFFSSRARADHDEVKVLAHHSFREGGMPYCSVTL